MIGLLNVGSLTPQSAMYSQVGSNVIFTVNFSMRPSGGFSVFNASVSVPTNLPINLNCSGVFSGEFCMGYFYKKDSNNLFVEIYSFTTLVNTSSYNICIQGQYTL